MSTKPESLLIDSVELAALMGVATSTVKRWSRNGDMPQGRRVGPRLLKWERAEIREWMEAGCPRVESINRPQEAVAE